MEITAVLTRESLEKLLVHLDNDPERAGERYESLRQGLLKFFAWRGCTCPEELADEVIDRVARKIAQGEEILNIRGYVTGVARFVHRETVKAGERHEAILRQMPRNADVENPMTEDDRLECIRACLRALPEESYKLVMAYYQDDKKGRIESRRQMARQMDVSPDTLRMRLLRLRAKLEECVVDCVNRRPGRGKRVSI